MLELSNLVHMTDEQSKYNVRAKYYPGESDPVQILITENHIFNPDKVEWEDTVPSLPVGSSDESDDPDDDGDPGTESRGCRQGWLRAKRRAYDFIRSTPDLDCFLTLTLDPERIERSSWDEVVRKLSIWLDNRVRRHGLMYILCPEYHKDGKSIHFHGLANTQALKLVEAYNPHNGRPIVNKGKQVYNVDDFPFGFSTAIHITGDEASKACAGYIFKYMSKQGNQGRIGGRYYLSGGALRKPIYLYGKMDYNAVTGYEIPLLGSNGGMKVLLGDELKAFLSGENRPVSDT